MRKSATKSGALRRQQLGERLARRPSASVRQDHLAHGDDALVVEEHVLGAAKPDPLRAEAERGLGIARRLGVGADAQPARAVGPVHKGGEVVGEGRLDGRHRAFQHDLAAGAVDGDDVAGRDRRIARPALPRRLVDAERAGAGDAGAPHAAGDHGGVAGHAAPAGEDAPGGVHAVDVLGAGLGAEQDDRLAAVGAVLGLVGVNTTLPQAAPGDAGRPRAMHPARRVGVEGRVEQLLEGERIHPRRAPLPR